MLSRLRCTRRGRAGGGRKRRLRRAKRCRSCELRWAKTRRENSMKGKQGDSSPVQDTSLLQPITPSAQQLLRFAQFKSWGRNVDQVTEDTTLDIPPRFSRHSSAAPGEKCHRPIRRWRPRAGAPVKEPEDKWCFRDLRILQPVQGMFTEDRCRFHFPIAKKCNDRHVGRGWSSFVCHGRCRKLHNLNLKKREDERREIAMHERLLWGLLGRRGPGSGRNQRRRRAFALLHYNGN